jgi:N-formylglutamate amidohydrolase
MLRCGRVTIASLPPVACPPVRMVEIICGRNGPVILSVPHSGRHYSRDLLARSRLGQAALERLEDPLVDVLVQGAIDRGAAAVIARAPRALIDVNRSETELDPRAVEGRRGDAPTARARAGLGLIPTRLAGLGALWRMAVNETELAGRLNQVHRPYHQALAAMITASRATHDNVLLLDCHSMPPRAAGEPQIVIGDRHGTSAAADLISAAEAIARRRGFTVARNIPFAGGEVIARHGDPLHGVHALQIEVDRSTYCQRDLRRPGVGFDRVALLYETLSVELGERLSGLSEAAE